MMRVDKYAIPHSLFNTIQRGNLTTNLTCEPCCLLQKPNAPAPFTQDPECEEERKSIDYTIRITKEMAAANKGSFFINNF